MVSLEDLHQDVCGWTVAERHNSMSHSHWMVAEIHANELVSAPTCRGIERNGFAGLTERRDRRYADEERKQGAALKYHHQPR
ncbi:MAG TPA: hypothetical protein VGJ21_12185 [Terracidiphilus sp.]|jgi:hypothetical protein